MLVNERQIRALLDMVNAHPIIQSLGRLDFGKDPLSTKRYEVYFHPLGEVGVPLRLFSTKRLVYAFVDGIIMLLGQLDSAPTHLKIPKIRYTLKERLFCPVCAEDITNLVKWKGEHRVYTGRCPDCEAVLKRKDSTTFIELWEARSCPLDVPLVIE